MAKASRPRGWPPPPEPLPGPVVDDHTHLDAVLSVLEDAPPREDDGARHAAANAARGTGGPPAFPPRTLADHLALAVAAGVPRMIQIGCDLECARWTDSVVAEHAELLGGVAIHPNEAVLHAGIREIAPDGLEPRPLERHRTGVDDAIASIAAIARDNPRIRVIGETGLDHFRAGVRGRAAQREAFRAHIALAKELDLVLQIHDRDAHAEVLEVLSRDGAPERTVFHCFSGDAAMARHCVERGWYLSFAGPVTYRANVELRRALQETPLDRLLLETDAPYLTPHPLRGRPNAPYLLPYTARAVAETSGRSLEEVCRAVYHTAELVYGMWRI